MMTGSELHHVLKFSRLLTDEGRCRLMARCPELAATCRRRYHLSTHVEWLPPAATQHLGPKGMPSSPGRFREAVLSMLLDIDKLTTLDSDTISSLAREAKLD